MSVGNYIYIDLQDYDQYLPTRSRRAQQFNCQKADIDDDDTHQKKLRHY